MATRTSDDLLVTFSIATLLLYIIAQPNCAASSFPPTALTSRTLPHAAKQQRAPAPLSQPNTNIGKRPIFRKNERPAVAAIPLSFYVTEDGLTTIAKPPNDSITPAPGSRPLSKFASDPTVSCLHNPHQQKCQSGNIDWNRERKYYTRNEMYNLILSWPESKTGRLSCIDFYNHSDGHHLWWQKLRQQTRRRKTTSAMQLSFNHGCDGNTPVDFYIHWQAGSLKKYVELHRGLKLQKRNDTYVNAINICYLSEDPTLPETYFWGVSHVFSDCLWHYGETRKNRSRAATNNKKGS